MSRIWGYAYTTASSPDISPDFSQGDFKAPMAGFGYGLPLSRLVIFLYLLFFIFSHFFSSSFS